MYALDHAVWAAPDLARGIEAIAALTGARPAPGGVHPGRGTQNALLRTGARTYLEIIAPDPAQPAQGTRAEWMLRLNRPGLVTWAAARGELEGLAARLDASVVGATKAIPVSRRRPDGTVLEWKLVYLTGHGFGPLVPFFIDWADTPHPATSLPASCTLTRLSIRHPQAGRLAELLRALDVEAEIAPGATAGLSVELDTPKGRVTLEAADPLPQSW
jgi:hypothetical protein